jgi:uncharacterized membrane protein
MPLRSARERIYQTLAFEAGGICIASPLYAAAFGGAAETSVFLVAALSIAVMIWSPIHNTVFDWLDLHFTGRVASDRSHGLRLLQALSLELTSLVATVPLVMGIGGHDVWGALGVNFGLTALYVAYGYLFHIVYDAFRPVVTAERPFPVSDGASRGNAY